MGNAKSREAAARSEAEQAEAKRVLTERCVAMYTGEHPPTAARLESAAAVSPDNLCALGFATMYGLFDLGPPNPGAAVECYRRAAAQQHPRAYALLASCHRHGLGVPRDVTEEDRLRLIAAQLGDGQEIFNLALAFSTGERCEQSWAQTAEWYRRGTEVGHAACMLNLGLMHEQGQGIPQNWPEAFRLYELAAMSETDNKAAAMAAGNLANCYTQGWGTEVNLPEAARWLKRAVDLGSSEAAFDLGGRHENGRGVPRDMAKAFALYKVAAAQGEPRATFNVANCLRNGWGCDVNPEAAVLLYTISANNGVPQARGELLKMQMAAVLDKELKKVKAAEERGEKVDFDADKLAKLAKDAKEYQDLDRKAARFQGQDGIDVEGLINLTRGITPMCLAAREGDLVTVTQLVLNFHPDLTTPDSLGCTPLHHAASRGHLDVVKYLITCTGAEVDCRNAAGRTPLYMAVQGNHEAVIKELVQRNADPANASLAPWEVLMQVAIHGELELVRFFAKECRADIGAARDDGNTALTLAATNGHLEVVKFLVEECNAELDGRTQAGATAVHLAASDGRADVVTYLVDRGASPTTPITGDVGPNAIMLACAKGHVEVVRALGEHCDVTVPNKDGLTAIHLAAFSGNPSILRLLVNDLKADVNALAGVNRETALHCAAMQGRVETVRVLLSELQADVNALTTEQKTPTSVAHDCGHHDVVKVLVEAGGEPAALADANPAIDIAKKHISHIVASVVVGLEKMYLEKNIRNVRDDAGHRETLSVLLSSFLNRMYAEVFPLGHNDDAGVFDSIRFHGPRCVIKTFLSVSLALLPRQSLNRDAKRGQSVDLVAAEAELIEQATAAMERIENWGCFSQPGSCAEPLMADMRERWQRAGCPEVVEFQGRVPPQILIDSAAVAQQLSRARGPPLQ
eukprot:m.85304 g.85304  ORF g.85304 m.85304 type:complete len:916 (-) comp11373_c0_seq1:115-2862(-)